MSRRGLALMVAGPVYRHVRRIVEDGARFAAIEAPKRSGLLARAVGATNLGQNGVMAYGRVSMNQRMAPYAKYVVHGTTGPIRARSGGLMPIHGPIGGWPTRLPHGHHGRTAGPDLGVVTFKRVVRGQAPNDFLGRGLQTALAINGHV